MDNKLKEKFSNEENIDKKIQNVENFTQSHEIQESKEKNEEEPYQKGLSTGTKGEKGLSTGTKNEKGSPAGTKGKKGSPAGTKGEKGSPAGTKGEKGSPAGTKGEHGSPTGTKEKKGSPTGTKGKKGSPTGTKGNKESPKGEKGSPSESKEERSPAGAMGLERSPAGAKGLERSPAGAKGLERSPAGAMGLERSPAEAMELKWSPASSKESQSWYEANDIDNWTPDYPFKTGFLSSDSPMRSEDQIKDEINFLLYGDKPRINKTFTDFYQEALDEINQHPSKLLDIWDTKMEEDCVRAILDLNSSKRLQLFGIYAKKSEFEACKLESQFNKSLNNGEPNEMLLSLISRSILLTPPEISSRLGHRYMKRASIFLKIRKFEESFRDARRSLNFYDKLEDLMWKSYEILGICYVKRSLCEKAKYCFSMALTGLSKCDCTKEEIIEATKRIEEALKPIRGTKDCPDSNYRIYTFDQEEELPSVAEEPNKYLDCASSLVMCKTFEGYGRCLMAAKDINPGDILIVEEAASSALNFENREDYCCLCLRKVVSPIPCYSCSNVCFCSEKCLVNSLSLDYHSRECEILPLLYDKSIGSMALLTYRIFLHFSWSTMKEYLIQFDSSKNIFKNNSETFYKIDDRNKYVSKNYASIFSLTTNAQHRTAGDLIKRALSAVYLLSCLKVVKYFKDDPPTKEQEIKLVNLALKHMQQTACNAYGINEYVSEWEKLGGVDIKELGGAIHPIVSLTNHSCVPNTFRYYIRDVCVLRAIRFIKKGEQIFDNYGVLYDAVSKKDRATLLSNIYKFKCNCKACEEDWPQYNKNYEPLKFSCPERNCTEIIKFCFDNTCAGCPCHGNNTKKIKKLIFDVKKKVEKLHRLFENIIYGEQNTELPFFQQFQIFLDKQSQPPARVFTQCQEVLKRFFMLQGNKS